jgi:hypothetical protein
MLKQASDGKTRAEMYILNCQVVRTKQMDFWEIFGRSGAVSKLPGSKASIYSHYRRTIIKEMIRKQRPVEPRSNITVKRGCC